MLGLSKGSIVFVRVDNLDYVYARYSIHRQAITYIHELKEHKVFLSICEELDLKIWGFHNGKDQVYQKFNIYREVYSITTSRANQMLLQFHKGDSEILVWDDSDKQLMKLKVDKSDEHEDKVTCCDALPHLGLFVTGDCEGLVKVWNCEKQLVREVKFVDPVYSVTFLNEEADILVGHFGNLSRLNHYDYMDNKTKTNITEEEFSAFMSKSKLVKEKWFRKMALGSKHTCAKTVKQEKEYTINSNMDKGLKTFIDKAKEQKKTEEENDEEVEAVQLKKEKTKRFKSQNAVIANASSSAKPKVTNKHSFIMPPTLTVQSAPSRAPQFDPQSSQTTGSQNNSQMRAAKREKLMELR